jgi:hypothetical protein
MIKMDMLGPAQVSYGDCVLDLPPLERLVHIALRVAGGTRSTTELIEDVWPVPTPGSAGTLRGCLSRARAKLAAAGGAPDDLTRTVRLGIGRTVVTSPGQWDVDAERFCELVAAAQTAYRAARFDEAQARAKAALNLWYDDPLPDAGGRPFALQYIEELRALHLVATLTKIKAGICLGGHREVVAELRHLSTDRPGEGEIAILLATALYRSDLATEAAAVSQRAIADREGRGIEARPHRPSTRPRPAQLVTEPEPYRNGPAREATAGRRGQDSRPTFSAGCRRPPLTRRSMIRV